MTVVIVIVFDIYERERRSKLRTGIKVLPDETDSFRVGFRCQCHLPKDLVTQTHKDYGFCDCMGNQFVSINNFGQKEFGPLLVLSYRLPRLHEIPILVIVKVTVSYAFKRVKVKDMEVLQNVYWQPKRRKSKSFVCRCSSTYCSTSNDRRYHAPGTNTQTATQSSPRLSIYDERSVRSILFDMLFIKKTNTQ
ncbi:hypothetical protein RIR_jg32497.t2 [Rhizophagus irregularis DAOM 181602=DAOM 197198]|nr:hypothetical protein RIR_jg32497.t1 [Rhizophagus irregularis DAOM 181602=DAOM 197198]GET50141.1 hypothetical protein RIR_jg32497.t2 [Rhizophagus irregularis DAOM 181602=DAOM 197198]